MSEFTSGRFRALVKVAALVGGFSLPACECSPPPERDASIEESDAPPPSDGGPTSCPPAEPFPSGDDGAPNPLDVPAGQSRAGRLGAGMLPPDETGLAVWREGDFVLASSAGFALIVEQARVSDLYDRFGGRPAGIARLDDGRLVEAGNFNEILFGFSTFLTRTESVSVVADGSDGGPAIVRVNGPLAPIDFAGNVLDVYRGTNRFEGFPSSMEYRMEPGADRVDISMTVENPGVGTQTASRIFFGIFQSNRMPVLNPASGFDELSGSVDWLAFADLNERTSWALVAPAGMQYRSEIAIAGVTVLSLPRTSVAGCSRLTIPLGSIALGRGIDGAQASARRARGESSRTVTGIVYEADGTTPVPGVHVHALVADRYVSRTTTDEAGRYRLSVPMADVTITAWRRGTAPSAPTTVSATEERGDVRLPPAGEIEVEARLDGRPVPARVQIFAVGHTVPSPAPSFGERNVTSGRLHVVFPADGRAILPVAPGTYDVVVSRGYEYELFETRVTVAAGNRARVVAPLVHSVDTAGWMCADYHIHTTRSPDSDDDAEDKILALVADGLELPVRSEHEFAADFQPVVERLGLTAWARGLAGEEITTWTWGHFGAFPLRVDATRRNGHIPNIYDGALPPDVFGELRARPERPLLIINHPRGAGPGFGYFNAADYDPVTGMVDRPEYWDEDFRVVEVFNDSSFESNRGSTVVDWFSFLRHGRRVFAVGSSDSHRLYGSPVGYPRTCLHLGTDDPRAVTPEMVRDATEQGRSFVSGGIYLDVTGPGGERPGQTVSGAGARSAIAVRVQAAEWIDADELEVIVDGTTTTTIPLARGVDPVVRFEGTIPVDVAPSGSWVIVHVRASNDMDRLHPGREPFAVSNPIFFVR